MVKLYDGTYVQFEVVATRDLIPGDRICGSKDPPGDLGDLWSSDWGAVYEVVDGIPGWRSVTLLTDRARFNPDSRFDPQTAGANIMWRVALPRPITHNEYGEICP